MLCGLPINQKSRNQYDDKVTAILEKQEALEARLNDREDADT